MTELEIQKIEAVADMMGDTPAGQIVRGAAKEVARLRAAGVTVLATEAIQRGQAELDYCIKEQGWDKEYASTHAEVVFLPATPST